MSADAPEPSLATFQLVARFLRSHNLTSTLDALLHEADPRLAAQIDRPPADSGNDLQDVVEDWIAQRLSRLRVDDPSAAPLEQLRQLEVRGKLPDRVRTAVKEATNVLSVTRGTLPRRSWDSSELRFRSEHIPCIFTTAVDRSLKVYSADSFELLDSFSLPSPALSIVQHPQDEQARYIACATMEGSLSVIDLVTREVKVKAKDHTKYIVRVTWSSDGRYLVTLGYDKLVQVYRFSLSAASFADAPALLDDEAPDPLALNPAVSLKLVKSVNTRTNPEAAVFLPDSRWLVYSAREDHLLHYLEMPAEGGEDKEDWREKTYNLNENGDEFVSFSILYITLHPTLPLLSLQTSTTNARLLLYPFHSPTRLLTVHTTASQSDYFNPRHAWLPSGAAAVVNSEDGLVRIVDLAGRVRVCQGAHGPAAPLELPPGEEGSETDELRSERARARREADKGSSVIRDVEVLPCGPALEEVRVLSCGFDKTVKVMETA
ncbi:hypothetical protein JCM10207_006744 [Rhodosporidiobolus poonsookiae]